MKSDPDDMYESPVIAVIGWLIVGIPAAALVFVAYYTGTWMGGGLLGGIFSVVTTGGMVWLLSRRAKKGRR